MTPGMKTLGWIGTVFQVAGVFLMSGRLASPMIAFEVMLAGSVIWSIAAAVRQEWSMLTLNLTFCVSNVVGMWRWA